MSHTEDPAHSIPLIAHLIELRNCLLKGVAGVLVLFVLMSPWANDWYALLAQPLSERLPEGGSLIATEVSSPFFAPFKFTFFLALFLAMPWLLWQLWRFISPGLYRREQRFALPLLVSSIALFYAGALFAYWVVFPLVFGFMISIAPEGVAIMTDISHYLDFAFKMFFAFGLAFEVPVATILLVKSGVVELATLRAKRPLVIVLAFVFGMLLTPPDILSQVLLAVPMWLLFELGVWIAASMQASDAPDVGEEKTETEKQTENMHEQ